MLPRSKRDFPEVADGRSWKVPWEAREKHGEKHPGAQECRRWEGSSGRAFAPVCSSRSG